MQTQLESVVRSGKIVKVTLHAKRDSKYSSLDNTCLKHFQDWQMLNYRKLGYKSSKISHSESCESNVDGMYYYTLVIQLVGLPRV